MSSVTSLLRSLPRQSIRLNAWTQKSCCFHSCARSLVLGRRNDGSEMRAGCRWSLATDRLVLPSSLTLVRTYSKGKDKGKDKKGKGGKPRTVLSDSDMLPVVPIADMRDELSAIVDALKETYIKTLSVRSGTGIEDLVVEFDGSEFPLKELAAISRRQANTIVLNLSQMPDALKPVMKAITESGMNVNPQQEGTTIFLQLPRVTREHREILAKNAKTLFQKAKEELTRTGNKYIKAANDAKLINNLSADLVLDTIDNIRYLEQKAIAECESHLSAKTKELLGDS